MSAVLFADELPAVLLADARQLFEIWLPIRCQSRHGTGGPDRVNVINGGDGLVLAADEPDWHT